MNTLGKFKTQIRGRSWEDERDVLYLCRLLRSVALAEHPLLPNKRHLGKDACMISEKNVARNENEKTQERPTKTSYCLHDLTPDAENKTWHKTRAVHPNKI